MQYRVVFCGMSLALMGCASQNQYVEPNVKAVGPSSIVVTDELTRPATVNDSLANTWNKLSSSLSGQGIAVEKADQGFSSMSIQYTGDPKNYLDCGRIVSKVKTSKGEQNYNFPAAQAYKQYRIQQKDKTFLVDRRMIIDIRSRLKLEEMSRLKTKVSLESSYYSVTRDQLVRGGGSKPFGVTDKIDFDLQAGAKFPNAQTLCRATGKYEAVILSLIK